MNSLKIYRASAGSGKTHNLTQEYLKLAFKYPDKFSKILAVTFTNKAANEMKERIITEINNLIEKTEDAAHFTTIKAYYQHLTTSQIKDRAQKIRDQILHNYSSFEISTIDSFVQKIIRAFSYEIQVPSGYRIELDNRMVLNELTEILYQKIKTSKELRYWLLQYANYKINEGKNWDFRNEIQNLANEIFKENFLLFELQFSNLNQEQIRHKLKEFYLNLKKLKNDFEQSMQNISKKTVFILDNNNIEHDKLGKNFKIICNHLLKKIYDDKDYLPAKTVIEAYGNLEKWYAKSASKDVKSLIISLYEKMNPLLEDLFKLIENDYSRYITATIILKDFYAFGILKDIAALLPEYRMNNNLLLISDTTLLLRKIIDNNDAPFIYEKTGSRFQNILIDEFQDTSGFQWDIFSPLIKNAISTGDTNLIVGDVKQSIYRWRGGDWRILLEKIPQQIGEEYIDINTLETNWRSKRNIIDFNNAVFKILPEILQNVINKTIEESQLNRNEKQMLEPCKTVLLNAYSDSYQNYSPKSKNHGGRVKAYFFEGKFNKWKEKINKKLPESIDQLLKNKNYTAKDICILVRTNNQGKEVVNMLLDYMDSKQNSEKYAIISAESLYINNAISVKILINAIRFIFNPNDKTAFSNLLIEYSKYKKSNIPISDLLRENIESVTDKNILPQIFISELEALRSFSLFELSEVLIRYFDLNTFSEEITYIQTFQDVILDFTRQHSSDLSKFLSWWNDKGSTFSIQLSEKQDAVKVMTIHKSKGLAFKVVIVPFCDWSLDHGATKSPVIWAKNQYESFSKFNYLPVRYSKAMEQSFYSIDYYDEKLYAYMDALNMLYVAFTRPKDELIIFSPTFTKSSGIKNVGQLLHFTIFNNSVDNDKYICFETYIKDEKTEDEKEEEKVFEIDKGYNYVDAEKYKKEKFENEFRLDKYPSHNWNEKISITYHSSDFFLESIPFFKERVDYGTLMHEIFSKIITPDDIDNALEEILFTGKISESEKQNLKIKIEEIINREEVSDWFNDKWEVVTEQAILSKKGIVRIPDRILISDNEVVIIDFKFGEVQEEHKMQIQEYIDNLIDMGYKKVNAYLYYADKGIKIAV